MSYEEKSVNMQTNYKDKKKETSPYYIKAYDYTHEYDTFASLHYLCSEINKMGYEAYVDSKRTNGNWWTPRLTDETKVAHYLAGRRPITLYSENIKGNDLGLGLQIRILSRKKIDDKIGLLQNELGNVIDYSLHIPFFFEKEIETIDEISERPKKSAAVYYDKYVPTKVELDELNSHLIDVSTKTKKNHIEIVRNLKSVEILYCFEYSPIVDLAILCGCAVVLIQKNSLKELPIELKGRELKGIAWGRKEEDVNIAISTVNSAKKDKLKELDSWISSLQEFIEITQNISEKQDKFKAWPQDILDDLPLPNLTAKNVAAKKDRKKYKRVNQQYEKWRSKSTLREIDADIYAEYITKGNLPSVAIFIKHSAGSSQSLIADTLDSIDENFVKAESVLIISENDPPIDFVQSDTLSWNKGEYLHNESSFKYSSDWILTLEAGVRLAPNALIELSLAAQKNPNAILFYADEDIFCDGATYSYPNFKPKFNIELIRCTNYIGNSVLLNKIWWIKSGYPIKTDEVYKSLIECSLNQSAKQIHHVDGILFHGTGEINNSIENLEFEAARNVLLNSGLVKSVNPLDSLGTWLVNYHQEETRNTTLVMPTGVQPGYMREMLLSLKRYPCKNISKIILVCNVSDIDEINYALYELNLNIEIEIITYEASEYSHSNALNLGVEKVTTKYVWVCDDDIELIQDDTLGVLLSIARHEDVGCVEPRLMSTHGADARLASGPVILGFQGACGAYVGEMQLPEEMGYFSKLQLTQDVSAVSGHCFVFEKSKWQEVGGFDSTKFAIRYSILDFCLKLNQLGYRHVWAPIANAMHQGGRSLQKRMSDFEFKVSFAQKDVSEKNNLIKVWGSELANDKFYNRHLSLITPYDVEQDIVIDWKPHRKDRPRVLASPLISGAGQYRVVEPLEMLQDKGLVQSSVIMPMADRKTRILQPVELIRARPDTLILQHSVDDAQLSLIDQYKKALPQVHIVQMVDDLLGFVPEKHPNRRFQSREGHLRMVEALKKSDSMIVTTEPLKDHYDKYIKNVKIIPNCLTKKWLSIRPVKNSKKRLRVGWIGAGQHQGDLEIINDVVKLLSDRVDWIFMGMHTEQVKPYIKEFHSFVSIKDYPLKMASLNLDIAVAPLEDNWFNQCKSNLRLLEYGAMGWPVVCSDVFPYQSYEPPVIRCKNNVEEWVGAITDLIDDESKRVKLGQDLNIWVNNKFNLDGWSTIWLNALID